MIGRPRAGNVHGGWRGTIWKKAMLHKIITWKANPPLVEDMHVLGTYMCVGWGYIYTCMFCVWSRSDKWVILTLPRINGYGYHLASLQAASKTPLIPGNQKKGLDKPVLEKAIARWEWRWDEWLQKSANRRSGYGRVSMYLKHLNVPPSHGWWTPAMSSMYDAEEWWQPLCDSISRKWNPFPFAAIFTGLVPVYCRVAKIQHILSGDDLSSPGEPGAKLRQSHKAYLDHQIFPDAVFFRSPRSRIEKCSMYIGCG